MAGESKREEHDPSAAGYDEAVRRGGDGQIPAGGFAPPAEEGRRVGNPDRTATGDAADQHGLPETAVDEVAGAFDEERFLEEVDRRRQREGMAPHGQHRADEEIRDEIAQRLEAEGFIDAAALEVTVLAGEVRLAGSVDSRTSRRRAEDVAADVSGVSDIQNDIRARDVFYNDQDRDQVEAVLHDGAALPTGAGADASSTSDGGVGSTTAGSGGAGGAGLTDREEAAGRRTTTAPVDDGLLSGRN